MNPERRFDENLLKYPRSRADPKIKPVFALARSGEALFFVNHSDELVTRVRNCSVGLFSDDDSVDSTSAAEMEYQDVQPGEAVKLDEFDVMFDGDFLIVTDVHVQGPSFSSMRFRVSAKGGSRSVVLLWSDGKEGRTVRLVDAES